MNQTLEPQTNIKEVLAKEGVLWVKPLINNHHTQKRANIHLLSKKDVHAFIIDLLTKEPEVEMAILATEMENRGMEVKL